MAILALSNMCMAPNPLPPAAIFFSIPPPLHIFFRIPLHILCHLLGSQNIMALKFSIPKKDIRAVPIEFHIFPRDLLRLFFLQQSSCLFICKLCFQWLKKKSMSFTEIFFGAVIFPIYL